MKTITLTLVPSRFFGPFFEIEGGMLYGETPDGRRFCLPSRVAGRAIGKSQTKFPELGEEMLIQTTSCDHRTLGKVIEVKKFDTPVADFRGGVEHMKIGQVTVEIDASLPYHFEWLRN